jgi:hypothetical protein
MTNMTYPPLRPLSPGQVLEAALQIFRVSVAKCLPFATLAVISLQVCYALSVGRLLTFYDPSGQGIPLHLGRNDPTRLGLLAAGALLAAGIWAILSLATLARQASIVARRGGSGGADLLEVLRRAPAIAALALLSGAATDVLFVPIMLLAEPYRSVGLLLMLGPALFVSILLFVLPACGVVLVHKGLFASVAHSFRLVRGHGWRTAGIYAAGFSILMVFYLLTGVLATMALPYAGAHDTALVMAISSAAELAISALGLTFFTALTLAVFGDLEVRRAPSP